MKKLLFLYNTHAGKGLLKSRLAAVQDALAAAGWDVTIHPTQGAGDATAVAAARAGEFDRIVCSGGDGMAAIEPLPPPSSSQTEVICTSPGSFIPASLSSCTAITDAISPPFISAAPRP